MRIKLTPEQQKEYAGKIIAISMNTNQILESDTSRVALRKKMFPLICGKHYYAYVVR